MGLNYKSLISGKLTNIQIQVSYDLDADPAPDPDTRWFNFIATILTADGDVINLSLDSSMFQGAALETAINQMKLWIDNVEDRLTQYISSKLSKT